MRLAVNRSLTAGPHAPWTRAIFLCVSAAAGLSACSTVPKEQTLAFSGMVNSVGTAIDPLFDNLSAVERRHKIAATAAHPTIFVVADAPYYSSIGDAPEAAQFRAGFAVIDGYTKLLVSLVDGSSAAAWQAQAQSVLGNITAITGSAISTGSAALLSGIFQQIASAYSNAEARRLMLSGKDPMIKLIDNLIKAGDPIFLTLIQDDQPFSSKKTKEQRKADIDAARLQVANYVVLLQQLKENFGKLSMAYIQQSSPETLSAIAATSGELAADAKAARAAYATLGKP
ncbi:hypothetical protein [Mesorhizobium carmichaelinearum]|uniref:hypothetical protein n=1 Tax=Mesorhizobium carmichaelinearum TaxID=1208188 RepID=UPI00117D6215|nr:hypothetical protein [Mesorhizobium carmichaelinearum]